jgi:hypothetical protein
MNNTDISRSSHTFASLADKTGGLLKDIHSGLDRHTVRVVFWDTNVLIYKSHIYDDVRVPKLLFESLREKSSTISYSSRISYESVYHVVLFAFDRNEFKDEEAAYEYGRQCLEDGERLKQWYQRFICSNNVSAPVLHDKTGCWMPSWHRCQGKRLKFGRGSQIIKLAWKIENGVFGARTYPSCERINLKSKLFNERTGQVTLEWREIVRYNQASATNEYVTRWKVYLNASATTQDVLQCIYDACKPILEQSGTSPSFQRLWKDPKEGERRYILELCEEKGREKKH